MKNDDIVITSAFRTPIGNFCGSLSALTASQLGTEVIKKCIENSKLDQNEIDTILMGQVLQAGCGQNPARQSAIGAGIPKEKTASTINQVCGSGLFSVALGYSLLKCDDAKIVVAGGQESMSNAPHYIKFRDFIKMGDIDVKESLINHKLKDSMITDGLLDAYNLYHMGMTAENVAKKFNIKKEEQDKFALNSQLKAIDAIKNNRFKEEIVEIKNEKFTFDTDEYPRKNLSLESLSRLKTIFKKNGTVTAGNSSGINDGAASLVLMSSKTASQRKIEPLVRIVSWAQSGVDPAIMGTGPIPATKKALEKAGWKINDLDLIESNEAFASQSLAVAKELSFDLKKLNVNGGAIALGHPIGASGTRILVTLIHEMKKRKLKKGLATLCVGGGMGIAMCIESAI
jgi:acetyl-CoA C-acetyltransferase